MSENNMSQQIVKANREHKSSVFSLLFSKPEILRELYSAIEGIELPQDLPISINTISGVLVKGLRNDISFIIDNRLVLLIEHQSTISENLPLKVFRYVQKVYDKIVDYRRIHGKQLIKIPKPEFIVLYNGKAPFPESKKLKLSDAFMGIEGLSTEKNKLSLELVVQVYNINHGWNQEIQRKCETVNEYRILNEKIREYEKSELPLAESIVCAVKYCIENNILKEFLKTHGSEVIDMLVDDYTTEDFIEAMVEEAREEEREKLQTIVANKDAAIADQAAEIARLQKMLEINS
jgi:hypothetical protein